ncbi:cobalt transporter ATP-binding subunit [Clostridium perfringens]|nr:cobalt transporter ATP-binding subunit [Clostridium perfringens]
MNIKRGEVTAILGGNGVGKSTLFQNFNGILSLLQEEYFLTINL